MDATEIVACEQCGRRNRVPPAAAGKPTCGSCGAPLPWIVSADDDSYPEIVEASKLPVLLDLWAPWCGPCRMVSPILEQLAHRYAGRVKLVKVNVDEAVKVGRRFAVRGIPTLVVLDRGKVLARETGAAPEAVLTRWLEQALAEKAEGAQAG
jgi:thioredoxin 2